MEVGNYVRTKNRGIWKLAEIRQGARKYVYELEKHRNGIRCFIRVKKDEVINSSSNIIDLIEVGDIVVTNYVNRTCNLEKKDMSVKKIKSEADLALQKFYFEHKERVLKCIVTKEQFEHVKYMEE